MDDIPDAVAHAAVRFGLEPDALRPLGGRTGLLHLDLHPFNVVVDDAGEPTGVIDWANAVAGDPRSTARGPGAC